jgi:hypothetical protein
LEDIQHAAFAVGAIAALPTILGQLDFSPTVTDFLNDDISNKTSILPYLNDINNSISCIKLHSVNNDCVVSISNGSACLIIWR